MIVGGAIPLLCGSVASPSPLPRVREAVVLRIHVVRDGGHAYYVEDLVPGRAEGGLVAGEEPGRWWGAGTSAVGLSGRVDGPAFAELLAGREPHSAAPLRTGGTGRSGRSGRSDRAGRAGRRSRSVSAYDLTLCAPKSVSLLHLLAPREIAEETGAAHRAAVAEALGYLEQSAVGVRRVRSGQMNRLPATGMVAGVFLHRTSRALDPHLHTHAVVANVALGVDGHWSALDSRRIFAHAQAGQAVYHARLRLELGERLGGTCEVAPSGLGELVGVDRAMRRLFSQRAAAMDEYRHRRATDRGAGRPSSGAFHATRPGKDRGCTVDTLRAEWGARAASFGFDLGDLTAVVGRCPENRDGPARFDHQRVAVALEGLARRGRPLARRDLVMVVAAASTMGASASDIQSVAEGLIDAAGGVTASWRPPGAGRAGQGRDFATGEPRWNAGDLVRVHGRTGGGLARGRAPGPTGLAVAPSQRGPTGSPARHRSELPARHRTIEMEGRPGAGRQLGR